MKVIATIYRSAGNEVTGHDWTETAIFDTGESIETVFAWATSRVSQSILETKIIITKAQ